jgi:hypothetical protein
MSDHGESKYTHTVTIRLEDSEGRMEKLPPQGSQPARIRISGWSLDQQHARPLDVSEKELVQLLQKAIRAGILSSDFIKSLHAEFEI